MTELIINVEVKTYGALDNSQLAVWRRTLALWLIAAAGRLLRTRLDIRFIA